MVGQTVSHYKILQKLGEGGMGMVYKAEDLKLKRTVALKVLPESFTRNEESKRRFISEAQNASSLQHNNICTIHEIDETPDGRLFIAMDYYEGQTLKSKISKKQLSIDEIINIAKQIAEGLHKAHEKGIIHRDIKPANIFLTKEGIVKILDFGLAKKVDQTQFTRIGMKFGTTDYMSPEQIKGEKVDHRTDIWSLGILLYEMLTGQPPFKADYEQAIVYLILNQDPEDVRKFREDVPERLLTILEKSIAKEREDRYEDIGCLLEDLRNIKSRQEESFQLPEPRPSQSIAVLPFVNMSTDPEQESFCDGLTEELISTLSRVRELKVVASTSAFSFKGGSYDIRKVGRKLDVKTVLEGSVRKEVNKLRITAQLINVLDGYHLWSERYDRESKDIFNLQEEISLAIVDALKIKLIETEKKNLIKRYTDNIEAYNLFMQGFTFFNHFDFRVIGNAMECFNKALEKDPYYALAYYGLAGCYFTLMWFGIKPTREALPDFKKYMQRTLEIDENCAGGYHGLGLLKGPFEWKNDEADSAYRRGIELNPNDTILLANYSMFLIASGNFEAAKKYSERALIIDPISDFAYLVGQYADFCKMKFEQVAGHLSRFMNTEPPFWWGIWFLWRTLSMMGKKEEAVNAFKKCFSIIGAGKIVQVIDKVPVDNVFQTTASIVAESYINHYSSPYDIAIMYIHARQKEEAFKWLQECIRVIDPKIHHLNADPDFQCIRNDERFLEFVKIIGMAPVGKG